MGKNSTPKIQSSAQPSRPPRPPRRDPRLKPDLEILNLTGNYMTAFDIAEFDGIPYPNLDRPDQRVYLLAYLALLNYSNLDSRGRRFRHRRSHGDRLSRARRTLRALKQVSDGVRGKFETTGGWVIKQGQM